MEAIQLGGGAPGQRLGHQGRGNGRRIGVAKGEETLQHPQPGEAGADEEPAVALDHEGVLLGRLERHPVGAASQHPGPGDGDVLRHPATVVGDVDPQVGRERHGAGMLPGTGSESPGEAFALLVG